MRCFLIFGLLAGFFAVHSQNLSDKVSVAYQNETLVSILTDLSSQTSMRFAYNPDQFEQRKVSYQAQEQSLKTVLDELLTPAHQYVVRGSYVVVIPVRNETPTAPQKITGSIKDAESKEDLSEVTIYEIHELKPVLTSKKGSYALNIAVPQSISFLAISKANYQDTVIQVTRETKSFSVYLKPIKQKTTEIISGLDSLKIFRIFTTDKMRNHLRNVTLEEVRFAQISLTPGLSSNGFFSGQISNRLSLNLVGGVINSLHGFEVGGVFNMERNSGSGFQIGGAVNIVGENFKGFQIGGATNLVLGRFDGLQIGGATNHTGDFDGVQLAGAVNTSRDLEGWQVSGGTNHARDVKGVQLSSIINTSRNFDGWQVTSVVNYNRSHFKGIQLSSFWNQTDTLSGLQVGIINVAKKVESGVPIGFVNWIQDELHHVEVSYNDLTPVNVSFRSGLYRFYTLLQAGISPGKEIWSYGLGLGSQLPVKNRMQMAIEFSEHVIQPLGQPYLTGYSADTRLHWRLSYQVSDHFTIQGGPVFHFYHYNPDAEDDTSFTEQIGSHPWFERSSAIRISKGWLGYEFLVRF